MMRLYSNGELHIIDERVDHPVTFAHVTDLHLAPEDRDPHQHAIDWWEQEMDYPWTRLPQLLDEIQAANVDFVVFGGDQLDCYDAASANRLATLCRERELRSIFGLGNHDYENLHIRYVTHEFDADVRDENFAHLCDHWNMPGRYYSFEHGNVSFIMLDTPYKPVEGGWGGYFEDEQLDWLTDELQRDVPTIVFHHVPFDVPTNRARLGLLWNGGRGWIVEDENAKRARQLLADSKNVLGTFVGHSHIRSEDPLGNTWQFMTGPGCHGNWRYVRIAAEPAPKSIRVGGVPG